ncbi:MAG: neutral/alkaline non-lysosomal ceramidase N-terminal domain-containing protein [Planctomycetaceae bacterium]
MLFNTCRLLIVFTVLLIGALVPCSALRGDDTWKAGAAKTVITPKQYMWMSGYASRSTPAQGMIHDLYAKALAIQDPSGHTAVVITLDLVGVDRATSQKICQAIEQQHKLERSQVSLATSHTHSGPVVGTNLLTMYSLAADQQQLVQEYTARLIEQCVATAGEALGKLSPVTLHAAEGTATFAVNRRNNREADVPMLREQGKLMGPIDHTVPVLAARSPSGELKAVLFGYACHATVLSGMEWCGDWPGFAQIELEKAHPGTIALFWAGCGADQNPLPRRTVELAQNYGQQAAAAVDQALVGTMRPVTGKLSTRYTEIDLALDTLPTAEQVDQDLKSENVYIARRAAWLKKQYDADGKLRSTYPYPIQAWKFGDAASLTFLGGEVVVDYSLRLRSEVQDDHAWFAGYSNDVMAYIPSRRVLTEGGYEGESSMIYYGLPTRWSPDVEEHIVRETRKLHEGL